MKANELMTGDWVKLKNNHCKSIQLTAIDETYNSINYFDGDAEGELTLQLKAIEPIPLTPEILEKNGFVKQEFEGWEFDGYRENSGLVYLVLWRNDYSKPHLMINSFSKEYGTYSSFNISSLHQLQHALRLCGISLDIVV